MDHYYKPSDEIETQEIVNFESNLKELYKKSIFYKDKEKQEDFRIMFKNFYGCEKFKDLTPDQYLRLNAFLSKNEDTSRLF